MSTNNNPFPFYTLEGDIWTNDKPLWHHNSNNCSSSCCYNHTLYPGTYWFQHKMSSSFTDLDDVNEIAVRKFSDNSVVPDTTITTSLIFDSNGNKFLIIKVVLDSSFIGDKYYISIDTTDINYYSEVFCVANNLKNKVGIMWSSKGKVGNMVYNTSYKHYINLDAKIVPAEPQLEQEVRENGFNEETPVFQKLTQPFVFSCIVPNFLANAISAIPLHSEFNIFDYFIGEFYVDEFNSEIKNITTVITPEDDGCNSMVEIKYIKETVIKTGCENDLYEIDNLSFVVYDENLQLEGGEFDTSSWRNDIDLESNVEPQSGSKHILMNPDSYLDYVVFQGIQRYSRLSKKLKFFIKILSVDFLEEVFFVLTLTDTVTGYSTEYIIQNDSYGIDIESTDYQLVEIPLEDDNTNYFNKIVMLQYALTDTIYVDNITIEPI